MANEVDAFLGDINEVPADPFAPTVEDPFAAKEKVEVKKEEDEEEVKPLPFHKDPKVQRYVEKEISRALKDIKPTETERFVRDTSGDEDEATEILTRIIGNDTTEKVAAIKDFKKYLGGLEERGAQKALKELQDRQEQETEKDRKAQSELNQGFEDIEETYDVDLTSNAPTARKTRAEFIDYIKRIAPKNEAGEVAAFPDLNAAFEEFQEKKKTVPQPNSRAKELASRSMARSNDASNPPANTDKSWNAVDRLFSRLGN